MASHLTAKQVADRLQVSVSWVYKHKRVLGGVQVGSRMWRFPEASIEAYLQPHAPGQTPTRRRQPVARSRRQWRLDY
jgi:excisionase family DNA binding protein